MSQGLPPGYVLPKPQTAKLVGTLNIVFASLLLLCGLGEGLALTVMPMFVGYADSAIQQKVAEAKATAARQVAELKAQEAKAESDEEKDKLKKEREQIESELDVDLPNMSELMGMARDPRVLTHEYTKVLSGLFLNVLMLVSGIGLVGLHEWSRKLAIWVAGLKMARLLVVGSWAILVVIPIQVQVTKTMFAKLEQQAAKKGQAPPMGTMTAQMSQLSAASETAKAVGYMVIGAVWPVVALVLLTRPGTRAACVGPKSGPAVMRDDFS